MKRALTLILLLSSGCSYSLHQYQASDYGSENARKNLARARAVEATGEKHVILGLSGDTDYVEATYRDLQAKCRHGEIVGINSRYSTSLSFLSYTEKLHMQGLCLE